jgi:hypothetical protein
MKVFFGMAAPSPSTPEPVAANQDHDDIHPLFPAVHREEKGGNIGLFCHLRGQNPGKGLI